LAKVLAVAFTRGIEPVSGAFQLLARGLRGLLLPLAGSLQGLARLGPQAIGLFRDAVAVQAQLDRHPANFATQNCAVVVYP
jgi:hypothetical protein